MKRIFSLSIVLVVFVLATVAQSYKVVPSKSELKWNGKKVTGEHYGKISIKEGAFSVKNNKVETGTFVIDMASITCDDLEGEWNDKLVGHLKSDDFFSVEAHPEATLKITGSTLLENNKATLKGDLTIKGITKPVEFEATHVENTFSAVVSVDRTAYNVRYGSGKFFDNLGDKTISDVFTMDVKIVAE
ncbi:MAG: YceI family protein [Prolixibacteraceae bacterium]|jgi:polyisoprenoid-binding protein YceI|nr:YceI family protein [Prolixibacteraceae bacterium]